MLKIENDEQMRHLVNRYQDIDWQFRTEKVFGIEKARKLDNEQKEIEEAIRIYRGEVAVKENLSKKYADLMED